jgi:hypothetical protein
MTNPILINELLADPSVSYWMKSSLQSALQRDPVDALRDAETLCEVLRQRLEFIGTN